jgi:hypothetical protein
MLEITKPSARDDITLVTVSLNIPRYINVVISKKITVKCDSLHFKEDYFYVTGSWKLTLVRYQDDYRLKKERKEE